MLHSYRNKLINFHSKLRNCFLHGFYNAKLTCDDLEVLKRVNNTAQKMKFSIKDFFGKCDQIRSFLWIWLYLLKKSLTENFIFCVVQLFLWFFDIKLKKHKRVKKRKLLCD